jgi:hypothetical protein
MDIGAARLCPLTVYMTPSFRQNQRTCRIYCGLQPFWQNECQISVAQFGMICFLNGVDLVREGA